MANTRRSFKHFALFSLFASQTALAQISVALGSTQSFGSRCRVQNATLALPQEGDGARDSKEENVYCLKEECPQLNWSLARSSSTLHWE
jgi:hypothetical protein